MGEVRKKKYMTHLWTSLGYGGQGLTQADVYIQHCSCVARFDATDYAHRLQYIILILTVFVQAVAVVHCCLWLVRHNGREGNTVF